MYILGTASNRFVRAIRNQAGGVTYVAMPGAVVGDSDEIRGERIHIVSNQQLRQIIRATPYRAPFLCTSLVTDMNSLFKRLENFNMPIGHWDTSRVTNMEQMFLRARSFGPGQQIGGWDVGRVTNMYEMFSEAESFNQPINRWNVSNVLTMSEMFAHAESFDQPIGDWDVGRVMSMSGMFYHAESFNRPINRWDVSNVLNMSEMFYSAYSFNQPIGNWNVARVTNMYAMFTYAKSFKQPGIAKWDLLLRTPLSRVYGMFGDAPRAEAAYKAGVAARSEAARRASMGPQTGSRRAALRASLNARGIPDDVVDKILYKAGVMQLRGLKDDEFRGKGTRLDRVRRRNRQHPGYL
jgi:surface protein